MTQIIPIVWRNLEKVFLQMVSFIRAPGAAETQHAERATRIKALRGKYRHALAPSDEFAKRKQEEIALRKKGSNEKRVRLVGHRLLRTFQIASKTV